MTIDFDIPNLFDLLCESASRETLPRFKNGIDVSNKDASDFDPVTEADREAERVMRDIITSHCPEHGIIGEEFGRANESSRYQWILDPIDGTRAFISGLPVWGTLVGFYCDDRPFAGVMDQPFTRERYFAYPDSSGVTHSYRMYAGGSRDEIRTRPTKSLSDATLMSTSPHLFSDSELERFESLSSMVRMTRYGGDCYAYCMVASGHIDLVVESHLEIYDIAALIPIIEGAGGLVTSWSGGSASSGGDIIASANKELHEQALLILGG